MGILYPGEMGSTLGKALARQGIRVVSTVEGRSTRTCHLCEEAGISVLPGLRDVARAADVVLAVVVPSAATALAEQFAACRREFGPQVYVDLNSISPKTVTEIGRMMSEAGVEFVDGAIHGLASRLPAEGTLYLSGRSAPQVADLFGRMMRVKVLGDAPGDASTFKMMISGMAKGIVALFLEMGVAARRAGLLEDLLACYRESYPGVMAVVDRMLPTYPQHAARRGEELREVEETLTELGLEPGLVRAARRLTAEFGQLGLPCPGSPGAPPGWPVPGVVEAAAANGLLGCRGSSDPTNPEHPTEGSNRLCPFPQAR